MRHFSSPSQRPQLGSGVAAGIFGPAPWTGLPQAAEAQHFTPTRTNLRRADARLASIFEHVPWPRAAAARVWSFLNDNAHVDRRAPPRRNEGGSRQGKPDRGV